MTDRPVRAQQERSRQSRRRILDAAVRVLVERGYANASTLRIQEVAGVSRGALLNHFPSRDALVVAAVRHVAAERIRHLRTRTLWSSDPERRIAEAVDVMWATYSQTYFWASIELWVAARSNDELCAALRPEEQATGAMVRESTDVFFGPDLCALPAYPVVRELLNTSMRGVALTYAFAPRDPVTDPHVADWAAVAVRLLLDR